MYTLRRRTIRFSVLAVRRRKIIQIQLHTTTPQLGRKLELRKMSVPKINVNSTWSWQPFRQTTYLQSSLERDTGIHKMGKLNTNSYISGTSWANFPLYRCIPLFRFFNFYYLDAPAQLLCYLTTYYPSGVRYFLPLIFGLHGAQ